MVEISQIKSILRQLIAPEDIVIPKQKQMDMLREGIEFIGETTTFQELGFEHVEEFLPHIEYAFNVELGEFSPTTIGELLTKLNESV